MEYLIKILGAPFLFAKEEESINMRKVNNMKTWMRSNYTIEEINFDYSLHAFKLVSDDGTVLGNIYPASVEDMQEIIVELDNGANPIEDKWEDGNGNTLSFEQEDKQYED